MNHSSIDGSGRLPQRCPRRRGACLRLCIVPEASWAATGRRAVTPERGIPRPRPALAAGLPLDWASSGLAADPRAVYNPNRPAPGGVRPTRAFPNDPQQCVAARAVLTGGTRESTLTLDVVINSRQRDASHEAC
jgi:hypothetical protein